MSSHCPLCIHAHILIGQECGGNITFVDVNVLKIIHVLDQKVQTKTNFIASAYVYSQDCECPPQYSRWWCGIVRLHSSLQLSNGIPLYAQFVCQQQYQQNNYTTLVKNTNRFLLGTCGHIKYFGMVEAGLDPFRAIINKVIWS